MANDRNVVEITLTARDLASPVVEKLRTALTQFTPTADSLAASAQRSETAVNGLSNSASRARDAVRGAASALTQDLLPATVSSTVATAALAGGFAAAGVAAVQLASILGREVIGRLLEARQNALDFKAALSSFNGDQIGGELKKVTTRFEELNREARSYSAWAQSFTTGDPLNIISNLFRARAERDIGTEATRATELRAAERFARSLVEPGYEDFEAVRQRDARARFTTGLSQRGLYDYRLEGIDAESAALERQALDFERGVGGTVDLDAAGRLRALIPQRRRFRYAGEILGPQTVRDAADFAGFEGALYGGVSNELRDAGIARREAEGLEALRQSFLGGGLEGAGLEQVGVGPTQAEITAGLERGNKERVEALRLDAERLQVATQLHGLTREEQAALQLATIEADKRLKLALAQGDVEKEQLANLEAQVRATSVIRAEIERKDPYAGLQAGFREVSEYVGSEGERLRDSLIRSFHDVNRGFADIVVAGLTGQAGKIGEIGRRMGESILRGLVEQFTTRATGSLFSGVNSLFGGGVRSVASVGVAGAVVAPATAGAGTPIGLPSGGTGIVSATGTVQPVTSTAGNVAYGAGGNVAIAGGGGPGLPGGGFFSGFFGPSVSVYDAAIAYQAAGFQGVAALQSGQAVVVGGEFISTTVGGYGAAELGAIGADAFAVAPSAAQGAGLVASQAFSFVGGVVGVGLSAYSAFQAGRSGDKYAALTGAASGAASGALAGSAIFPGIGTAIGAIAGAAIGAGAGAAGKSKSKGKSHAQREAKELKRVAQSVEGFESRVASATTLEDLYDALLEYTPASYGGEKGRLDPQTSDPAILLDRYRRGEISFAEMDRFINASDRGPGRAGFVFTFVHEGDRHAVARTDPWRGQHLSMRIANRDVFVEWGIGGDIETFVARIQAGVAEDQLAQINDAATVAVQRKVAELRQAEIGALLAFEDTFDAPGVPGTTVSRLTSFPQVRVDEVGARGRDLLFSTDQGALAGLTDDQIEALIRRIARVDRDRNLGAIDAEHLIF